MADAQRRGDRGCALVIQHAWDVSSARRTSRAGHWPAAMTRASLSLYRHGSLPPNISQWCIGLCVPVGLLPLTTRTQHELPCITGN